MLCGSQSRLHELFQQVRIDHLNSSLTFGTDLGVAQKEDVPEGPFVQSMPSEQIRNQLTHMANALNRVSATPSSCLYLSEVQL